MDIGIFISHSWKHGKHYDKLHGWIFDHSWHIKKATGNIDIKFANYSIPENNPIHNAPNQASLENAILSEIHKSDVVVIPTGLYANYSNWIQKEIKCAQICGNPILAVDLWGSERKSLVVGPAADKIVGWQKKSVIDGIWQVQRKWRI